MLYKFKSPAGGDVIMTEGPARQILAVLGKDADAPGIITTEQIPGAIAALRAEADRLAQARAEASDAEQGNDDDDSSGSERGDKVQFSQRIAPLIKLMELSQAQGEAVVWGV